MLSSISKVVGKNTMNACSRALVSRFSAEIPTTSPEDKWPPYNVCSLPFNIKPNPNHIKLKEPHKRANHLIRELSKEAAEKAKENMDFDDFRSGDAIEVTMKRKEGRNTDEVYRGVCIAKHNDYYNSTFTMRCNIANEGVTVLFSTYQPDIKSVHLLQQSFTHEAKKRTRKSKLYYLKDRPILEVKIPENWVPENKYLPKNRPQAGKSGLASKGSGKNNVKA